MIFRFMLSLALQSRVPRIEEETAVKEFKENDAEKVIEGDACSPIY